MTYFEGFISPVGASNKDAYRDHAGRFAKIAPEFGIRRMVESWADDVPHGEVTDFYRAVQAKDDETVVFSWFEYASKSEREAASEKFQNDPRMQDMMTDIPFDPKRMIFGGFEAIVDEGAGQPGSYISGFIIPISRDKKDAYLAIVRPQAAVFREHGALRVVQAWGDDLPEGKVTDYRRAVQAGPDETVVLAFLEWPSKQASVEAWDKMMTDERMQPSESPFDGKRMFWGGFEVLLDTAAGGQAMQASAPLTA